MPRPWLQLALGVKNAEICVGAALYWYADAERKEQTERLPHLAEQLEAARRELAVACARLECVAREARDEMGVVVAPGGEPLEGGHAAVTDWVRDPGGVGAARPHPPATRGKGGTQ